MLFSDIAATSAAVTATSGRNAKIELLADALRRLDPDEVPPGSAFLAGELAHFLAGGNIPQAEDPVHPAGGQELTIRRQSQAPGALVWQYAQRR